MTEYKIMIRGIDQGVHSFTYEIKDPFFEAFSISEIKHAHILATVLLKKEDTRSNLSIDLNGKVHHMLCDICAEDISIPISSKTNIIIKESNENSENTDEIIYLEPNQKELSIKHLLFELITLSLPNKRIHQLNEKGTTDCNKEMISLIDKYHCTNKQASDPRWDALKNLKIK